MHEPAEHHEAHDPLHGFTRDEIDRSTVPMSGEFRDGRGVPLIAVAVEKLRENGTISFLDAGCGTGRAAYDLKDQLLLRTHNSEYPEVVTATGVNDKDFSQGSEMFRVHEATADGTIHYIIDDIVTVQLPEASQDIIWSHETLMHNPDSKVAAIITHLLSLLKADGRFYFNILPEQRTNPEIARVIQAAREKGMDVFESEKEKWGDKRTFVVIRNDASHSTP